MNLRKTILITFVISLLILSACSSDDDTVRGRSAKSLDGAFLGGDVGLNLGFEENAPPNEVFDQSTDSFDLIVKLANAGESSVTRALVKLSGLEPSTWGLSQVSQNLPFEASPRVKSAEGDVIEPDPVLVEFNGLSYSGKVSGPQSFDLRADVCYDYSTEFETILCVLKDPLRSKDAVCTLDKDIPLANSGGPVHITEMKESGRPNGVTFTFTVAHTGTGSVYTEGSTCGLDGDVARSAENVVSLTVGSKEPLSGLTCEGFSSKTSDTSGTLRFTKEGTSLTPKRITCNLVTENIPTDFIKLIDLELRYAYRDSVTQEIIVKNTE
jgi:hypothetical protein